MSDILESKLVRSGTWGSLWLDGEQVSECYGCQIKVNKTKDDVARCRTLVSVRSSPVYPSPARCGSIMPPAV